MNLKLKILNFKSNWKLSLFFLALFAGVFLRVYKFSDWLYFKRDEARDAFVILGAYLHGPGWLPLLGPNATGASFFTGPLYYYFQYIAAVIFQSPYPAVLAYPDLFFSLLAMPLFYFFLKKYFSAGWSLALFALFCVNFLVVEYSRFAWNPNSLPFFNILYFYALLNVFSGKEKRPLFWAAVAGAAFAFATQLHVLSLVALPAITVVFLAINFKKAKKYLNWRKICAFLLVAGLLYVPMIINELITHGRNTKGLLSGVEKEPYYSSFLTNVLTEAAGVGQGWFLILTGYISNEKNIWTALAAWLIFVLPAVYVSILAMRKEENEDRKNFLSLSLLWLAGYLLVYYPVALHMQPRFLLPIVALPLIFTGVLLDYLWRKKQLAFKIICIVAVSAMILGNAGGTILWFREMSGAQAGLANPKPQRTIILKEKDGIVLWHLEEAAKYMKASCGGKPIYYLTNFEYGTPIRYVLSLEGIESLPLEAYTPDRPGCIFMFDPSRTGKGDFSEQEKRISSLIEQKKFGVLKIHKLELKENADLSGFAEVQKEKQSRQLFWKDVLNRL